MKQKNDLLVSLRMAAEANGGRPLGEKQFFRQSGLTKTSLWAAGFNNYGAACEAAGLKANAFLVQRMSDDELFRPLAILARKLEKYPTKGDFMVARKSDHNFPGWDTFKRREREGPESSLRKALQVWCQKVSEFSDVSDLLGTSAANSGKQQRIASRPVVNGHVYLMRYGAGGGAVYKIGLTDNVPRRHSQLNNMAPQDVRIVHTIPTDDPAGIENYWLKRFEPKRLEGKKELFRLTEDDVVAFRSRKYQ